MRVHLGRFDERRLPPVFPKHLTRLAFQHPHKSQKYRKITQFLFGNTIVMCYICTHNEKVNEYSQAIRQEVGHYVCLRVRFLLGQGEEAVKIVDLPLIRQLQNRHFFS